jgi:hypothetical protein
VTIKLPGFSGLRWHDASEASVQGKPPNQAAAADGAGVKNLVRSAGPAPMR